MRFLERERAVVEEMLPGLDEALRKVPLMALEGPDGPGIRLFRDSGGPGLLAPVSDQGRGATAVDALRVQRAVGSRAPSLAVATSMHHFCLATLIGLADAGGDGLKHMLVEGVASGNRLVAAGFAEEDAGAGFLSPSVAAAVGSDSEIRVNGVTRTHGLASSMDVLLAGARVPVLDGPGEELALAVVPAESEGLSFGGTGAENERVTLDDVVLPPELLVRAADLDGPLEAVLTAGFVWFQLLMTGSYLGAASALVERVLTDDRVPESERVRLLVEAEGAMSAAEGVARRIDSDGRDESALADSLCVRYSVQDALYRTASRAVELLNDLNPVASQETSHLAACTHGLALQPPARPRMTAPLAAYLDGGPLAIT
ncbi:acyl-CoA dehydrogenase family protein [Streptomyces spectabilis]|uniref:acyl-CoA dehydrogenase family protein n=1 Tax=Streptomyces spectabilis TaxID=68270 RepID=UPI0033DAD478